MSASSERNPVGRFHEPGPVPVAGASGAPARLLTIAHTATIVKPDAMAAAANRKPARLSWRRFSQAIPATAPDMRATPAAAVGGPSQLAASRTELSCPTIAALERPARSATSVTTSRSRRSSSDARRSVVASAACPAMSCVVASIKASRSSPESTAARICSRNRGSRFGPRRS
jgi:hypothetical protein